MDRSPLYDLETLFAQIDLVAGTSSTSTPEDRPDPAVAAELVDSNVPLRVTADPLDVGAWVDGIQNAMVLSWRAHRPVMLAYVAAAAVTRTGHGLDVMAASERLSLTCAAADAEWLRGLTPHLPPVDVVDDEAPHAVERAAADLLGGHRETLERGLVDDLVADGGPLPANSHVVVDGSIVGRSDDPRVVGVAKTVSRRWLADESVLWRLPRGWRSPRFLIPAGQGGPIARYSCYLRLHDASAASWSHGLVRLEAHDVDVLEPLAARCILEAQPRASGDARWDRHLAPVAACEALLRSRRPAVFAMKMG